MGMFTEWRDDAYAALQAKYAKLEADYKRLLEGDDWVARCIRLENLHKDLVDEHRVAEEQLAEARAENAALVAEFQRLADEPPTLEEIAADLDKIEMLERELAEAQAEIERLKEWEYCMKTQAPYEAAGATWELRHKHDQAVIAERDKLIEQMRDALQEVMVLCDAVPTRAHDMAKDYHLREIGRIVNVKGLYHVVKAALSAAERGEG